MTLHVMPILAAKWSLLNSVFVFALHFHGISILPQLNMAEQYRASENQTTSNTVGSNFPLSHHQYLPALHMCMGIQWPTLRSWFDS